MKMRERAILGVLCAVLSVCIAVSAFAQEGTNLVVTSSSFQFGADIPKRFTGNGENLSPALQWKTTVSGVKSYALIVEDPDAPVGNWVHWVVYNLPASAHELREGIGTKDSAELPAGAVQGKNSWDERGLAESLSYSGPLPPRGQKHHYYFRVFALDVAPLTLNSSHATAADVRTAMEGHVLAAGEVLGMYQQTK